MPCLLASVDVPMRALVLTATMLLLTISAPPCQAWSPFSGFGSSDNDAAANTASASSSSSYLPSSVISFFFPDTGNLIRNTQPLPVDDLDLCARTVVNQLTVSCADLTDEQLGKLSVMLLNCQLLTEGRPVYPCEPHSMTLRECTSEMSPVAWNAYLLMSNRARHVCITQQQHMWRRLAQGTITDLTKTAHTTAQALDEIGEGMVASKHLLNNISEDQQQVLERQQKLNGQLNASLDFQQALSSQQEQALGNQQELMIQATAVHQRVASTAGRLAEIEDRIETQKQNFDETYERVEDLLQVLVNLQRATVDQNFDLQSVVFYTAAVMAVFVATMPKHTARLRLGLLLSLIVNYAVERMLAEQWRHDQGPEEWQYLLLVWRRVWTAVALVAVVLGACRYTDPLQAAVEKLHKLEALLAPRGLSDDGSGVGDQEYCDDRDHGWVQHDPAPTSRRQVQSDHCEPGTRAGRATTVVRSTKRVVRPRVSAAAPLTPSKYNLRNKATASTRAKP
eukprot:m.504464 g.504464  ORF g.504464 m.504464 type:complete len:508 (+) comp74956_c0_seq1:132-1655(+)